LGYESNSPVEVLPYFPPFFLPFLGPFMDLRHTFEGTRTIHRFQVDLYSGVMLSSALFSMVLLITAKFLFAFFSATEQRSDVFMGLTTHDKPKISFLSG